MWINFWNVCFLMICTFLICHDFLLKDCTYKIFKFHEHLYTCQILLNIMEIWFWMVRTFLYKCMSIIYKTTETTKRPSLEKQEKTHKTSPAQERHDYILLHASISSVSQKRFPCDVANGPAQFRLFSVHYLFRSIGPWPLCA